MDKSEDENTVNISFKKDLSKTLLTLDQLEAKSLKSKLSKSPSANSPFVRSHERLIGVDETPEEPTLELN